MDESTRRNLIDAYTRDAESREARVAWRVNGHAFAMVSSGADCLGCGVSVSGWSASPTHEGVVAKKASRALPPCTKPWNLGERLKEIAQQYSHQGQSVGKGGKVTLESVNKKLDRILLILKNRGY